jgi:menaquinone-specific isochorismate synthase
MKSRALIGAIHSHRFAFGLKDKEGRTRIAWGNHTEAGQSSFSLRLQDFYFPRGSASSLWSGFPPEGEWKLENECEDFEAEPMEALSLGEFLEDPIQSAWRRFCEAIEEELGQERLQKAVPARSRIYTVKDGARFEAELLSRLFSGPANGTFRFFVKSGESWFFGATPEMLFQKRGKEILIPAIAGTRAVPDPGRKEETGRELFENEKERREHQLVIDGILETLKTLSLSAEAPREPTVLELRRLVHLYTPVRAVGAASSERLLALHPTPAVGGLPKAAAQEFLRAHEPLSRGLFASPLLFHTPEADTCLVAIRSGLFRGQELRLFAGAGYVKGSNWEAEWLETGKKMDTLALLLEEKKP